MPGSPGSTSRRRSLDRGEGIQNLQYAGFLGLQGLLVVILLGLAFVFRHDARSLTLCLITLIVPVGWTVAFGLVQRRIAAARRAGTWSATWEAAQTKRAMGAFGVIMVVWVLFAVLVVLYV